MDLHFLSRVFMQGVFSDPFNGMEEKTFGFCILSTKELSGNTE